MATSSSALNSGEDFFHSKIYLLTRILGTDGVPGPDDDYQQFIGPMRNVKAGLGFVAWKYGETPPRDAAEKSKFAEISVRRRYDY